MTHTILKANILSYKRIAPDFIQVKGDNISSSLNSPEDTCLQLETRKSDRQLDHLDFILLINDQYYNYTYHQPTNIYKITKIDHKIEKLQETLQRL